MSVYESVYKASEEVRKLGSIFHSPVGKPGGPRPRTLHSFSHSLAANIYPDCAIRLAIGDRLLAIREAGRTRLRTHLCRTNPLILLPCTHLHTCTRPPAGEHRSHPRDSGITKPEAHKTTVNDT